MNFDLESEKSILSGLFRYGKDAYVDISDIVKPDTLYDHTCQVFFTCLSKVFERSDKVDVPLFLAAAHELGLDSIVGSQKVLLEEIRTREIELNTVRLLGKKIAKLEVIRTSKNKLRTAMNELDKLSGEESVSQIQSIVESPGYAIQDILNNVHETNQLIGKNAVEFIESLIKTPNREVGVSTGFKAYDRSIGGGIRRGGFALMGARRKIGKSAFAVNVALYVAKKLKIPVLYLDTEMNAEQHLGRIHANLTSIPISTIEHATFTNNRAFVEELRRTAKVVEQLGITHERVAGKGFTEILAIARRWLRKTVGYHSSGKLNNCLIIYDYFKLMDPKDLKNLKEYEAIGYQATQLSDFLGEMDAPCLALVQLNREEDIAQSDRLSWLATSVCLLLEKTPEELIADGYENGNRKINFDVARFGGGLDKDDYINVDFNGECCQMNELGTRKEAKLERETGKSGFKMKEE